MNRECVYITDGSFDGLLTAVYEAWYDPQYTAADILPALPAQLALFSLHRKILTDPRKASKVFSAICGKISPDAARNVLYCWLSELPDCGRRILDYLRLGFIVGASVDERATHSQVQPLLQAVRKVEWEIHRLYGLMRLEELQSGDYLGVVQPDHNILLPLSDHFRSRLGQENFILHDSRRNLYTKCIKGNLELHRGRPDTAPITAQEEASSLAWKNYYDALAIQSRLNPKLQAGNMPRRYWKNLTENPLGALYGK